MKRLNPAETDLTVLFQPEKIDKILKRIHISDKDLPYRLELNKDYPLMKDLFGIKIEYGSIRFMKYEAGDIVFLIDSLFHLELMGFNKTNWIAKNSIDGIQQIVDKFRLEKLNPETVSGYILNNELAKFESEPRNQIVIKYKDSPENIFFLYRFYLTSAGGKPLLVIEKTI